MNTPTPELENLTRIIKRILPTATILFILASYIIMSVVNTLFLDLPKVLAVLCSVTLAFGRFLIIFTNFLQDGTENRKIQWEKIVGVLLTVVSLIELYISSKTMNPNNFLPVFLNISSIILVGFFLELSFIEKSKKSVVVKKDVIQNQDKSISNGNFREVLINHS
jgi:hypothetical protein